MIYNKARVEELEDLIIKLMILRDKRCLLEGCVFGYEVLKEEPKDNCIYCGRARLEMPSTRGIPDK